MREATSGWGSGPSIQRGIARTAVRAHSPVHVLLVEDDPWVSRVSARLLLSAGYLVTCAFNGRDALQQLARPTTPIDVVLLDQEVAPFGVDSVLELRRVDASVPVLIIADLLDKQANPAQPTALLLKPFTRADVVSAIEELRHPQPPR